MRKLGVNYSAKWGVPFAEFLKIIKDIGYDCFFTGVPKAENIAPMAQAAAELGLEWETMHAPFGHINDIWFEGEGGDTMLSELINGVNACVAANARILVVHLSSGNNAPPRYRHRPCPLYSAGRIRRREGHHHRVREPAQAGKPCMDHGAVRQDGYRWLLLGLRT